MALRAAKADKDAAQPFGGLWTSSEQSERLRDYAALLPSCVTVSISEGLQILILDLAVLIEVKAEVGAPKDAAVFPVLRRTLEERSRDRRS